jgi:hypothetical protein
MQPVLAILRAVARVMRRDVGTFFGLKVNNFFLFVMLLIWGNLVSGLPPRSAYPFLLLVSFLLLFPLSSDPLAKIPPLRRALWPLDLQQRAGLRLTSAALSPVVWITAALLLRTSASLALAFVGLAIAMQVLLAVLRTTSAGATIPIRIAFPGKFGPIAAATLRQLFSVLDTYIAIIIAISGIIYRFAYKFPDPAAYTILSLLIALALSTYAQNLFGLERESALTRYNLLPTDWYPILLTKDAAYLGLLIALTSPLDPFSGITFGLSALGIGHFSEGRRRSAQYRWRFLTGKLVYGVLQVAVGAGLAVGTKNHLWIALISIASYIAGTMVFARPEN